MTRLTQTILEDLSAFADLGTEAPSAVENGDTVIVRLIRNGESIQLSFSLNGSVVQESEQGVIKYFGLRGLLASPGFADLGKWSDMQRVLYERKDEPDALKVIGSIVNRKVDGGIDEGIESFDDILFEKEPSLRHRTSILLLNGPAGIGKTTFIRQLSFRRANSYRMRQRPLILHVESRGRMLQNITDLIAFSLQTLRVSVTYDQIPALIRNGLIVLAIDGFDELGDPNGYGLAWAQVNELITSSRGEGTLILSGRETFINREQMEQALTSVDATVDRLQIFELRPLQPDYAKAWLRSRGWTEELLNSEIAEPLFEEGSYALRPFFLSELAKDGVASQVEDGAIDDLLAFLVNAMIEREADKFGKDIESATTPENRKRFIRSLMEEVARDLAENQTDALSSDSLAWLAEVVSADIVSEDLAGILRNRAGVIAFLTNDERRGYRKFVHEQFANFFLSNVTINAVLRNEVPKFIRRNIFGQEFLENFCSVIRCLEGDIIDRFISISCQQVDRLNDGDRSRRNLAALVIAACGVDDSIKHVEVSDVSIDEIYFSETISNLTLKNVTINQASARKSDLRAVGFENCFIGSLLADDGTIPSQTIPCPSVLVLPDRSLTDPSEIEEWFRHQFERVQIPDSANEFDVRFELSKYPLFNLLFRVCRYKPYWIKESEERAARRILDDPHWDELKSIMINHEILVVRDDVQSSGRPASFYHVRHKHLLQITGSPPNHLRPFFAELFRASFRDESAPSDGD